jgi:predicted Rossmann fold flavoprotein
VTAARAFDAVVVGAGAAGFLAAITAARNGRRVLLLEKNKRAGLKILVSGGTRCNVTNELGADEMAPEYGRAASFLLPSLRAFDSRAARRFFASAGVETKVEPEGKVFPRSDRATDVLDALLRELGMSGAALAEGRPALAIERLAPEDFRIDTPQGPIGARRVVVTTGGLSYPKLGTTGDGYAIARAFGHRVQQTTPALVALIVDVPWVRALSGLTLPRARVAVVSGKKTLAERTRGFLFTHFGVSGPAAMDVSGAVARFEADGAMEGDKAPRLRLDFAPDVAEAALDEALRAAAVRDGSRPIASALPAAIPERLRLALLEQSGVPAERRAAELGREERRRLVAAVKATELPVAGTRGYAHAEVTAGGVDLREIEAETMESRFVRGLFFAGEVLDAHGPIGGFNFQAAFATGAAAGRVI